MQQVGQALRRFKPEVIHVTGFSELGLLGAWFSWTLGIPLVASWHANLHEYAGRRLGRSLWRMGSTGERLSERAEAACLAVSTRLYRRAEVTYAPNPQLCTLIQERTGRPCHLMQRGVNTDLFSGAPHAAALPRAASSYVGRLPVEKNVALLAKIRTQLQERESSSTGWSSGMAPRTKCCAGTWGQRHLHRRSARRSTSLRLRHMDLLVFPLHTDTFGNVVLEALATGVPAVVTPDGGPAHIVIHRETGWVVPDEGFAPLISDLARDPQQRCLAGLAARQYALGCSWDAVFGRQSPRMRRVFPRHRPCERRAL